MQTNEDPTIVFKHLIFALLFIFTIIIPKWLLVGTSLLTIFDVTLYSWTFFEFYTFVAWGDWDLNTSFD